MAQQAHPRASVQMAGGHTAVRQALAASLKDGGLSVWAQANGRDAALADAAPETSDTELASLSLGENGGRALVAGLPRLGVPVIICSSHRAPERVHRALAAHGSVETGGTAKGGLPG